MHYIIYIYICICIYIIYLEGSLADIIFNLNISIRRFVDSINFFDSIRFVDYSTGSCSVDAVRAARASAHPNRI